MSEQVLRPAWRNYWFKLMLAVLLGLTACGLPFYAHARQMRLAYAVSWSGVLLALALVVFGAVAVKIYSQKFSIDDKCIAQTLGLFSRNQLSIRLNDIRSIELNQSLAQRIFGIGDLAFYSAGTDSPEIKFLGILKPGEWKARIDQARDQRSTE